eukprot:g25683.t1
MGACAEATQWEATLQLLWQIPMQSLTPDLLCLSACLSSCARARQPKVARQVAQHWSERSLRVATVIWHHLRGPIGGSLLLIPESYRISAAISVCKDAIAFRGGAGAPHWQYAVALFASSGAEAHVANALISVYQKVALWEAALGIFAQTQQSQVDWMTTLLALCAGTRSLAKRFYLESPVRVHMRRDPQMRNLYTIDLHELPVEVALLAVEVTLDELEQLQEEDDTKLGDDGWAWEF